MKLRPILSTLLVLAALCGAAAWYFLMTHRFGDAPRWDAQVERGELEAGGLRRTFLYYAPSNRPRGAPLVFVLHGSGGYASAMRGYTDYGFERIAQREGAIVVYPQGFEKHWNDCRGTADYEANTRNIDDPAFFAAMIGWAERELGADPRRVLVFGISNGGHMVYRLALERPDLVLAGAALAGGLPVPATRDCRESGRAVAMAIFNGTGDPINPFDGGLVTILGNSSRGEVLSSPATARFFAALAGYGDEPVQTELSDRDPRDSTRVRLESWSAPGRPEIAHYTIEGGGHTIPSQVLDLPRIAGRTSHDIDAVQESWKFFRRQWASRTP